MHLGVGRRGGCLAVGHRALGPLGCLGTAGGSGFTWCRLQAVASNLYRARGFGLGRLHLGLRFSGDRLGDLGLRRLGLGGFRHRICLGFDGLGGISLRFDNLRRVNLGLDNLRRISLGFDGLGRISLGLNNLRRISLGLNDLLG